MTEAQKRASTVLENLDEAVEHLRAAKRCLANVDEIFGHRSELSGMHSIKAERGALELVTRSLCTLAYSWGMYAMARNRRL